MKNRYALDGDTAVIYIHNGEMQCKVDAADLAELNKFPGSWGRAIYGQSRYARAQALDGHPGGLMHRIIMNALPGELVDHINHDGLDNRRENLRIVTAAQNMQNRRQANRQSKSGVRGVHWHAGAGKWAASATVDRKNHHLGLFADIVDADAAAIAGRARLMTHATN